MTKARKEKRLKVTFRLLSSESLIRCTADWNALRTLKPCSISLQYNNKCDYNTMIKTMKKKMINSIIISWTVLLECTIVQSPINNIPHLSVRVKFWGEKGWIFLEVFANSDLRNILLTRMLGMGRIIWKNGKDCFKNTWLLWKKCYYC